MVFEIKASVVRARSFEYTHTRTLCYSIRTLASRVLFGAHARERLVRVRKLNCTRRAAAAAAQSGAVCTS